MKLILVLTIVAFGCLCFVHEKELRKHKRRKNKEVGAYLLREKL